MIPNHRRSQPDMNELNPAIKHLDKTADWLLKRNNECFVPCASGEVHNGMNNCHIIAEGFLGIIADARGEILCWPSSVRSLVREAIKGIPSGQALRNFPRLDIPEYQPVAKNKKHKDVKYTFACRRHDNNAFKSIDTVAHFNPYDVATQLNLGLRTVAAYTAFYRAHKLYASKDFWDNPRTRNILAKYSAARLLAKPIQEFADTTHKEADCLERELKRWQTAYSDCDLTAVVASVKAANPTIKLAGTSIKSRNGRHIAVTILPTIHGESTIITTLLATHSPFLDTADELRTQKTVQDEAAYMKDLLEQRRPGAYLAELVSQFEFLYICKNDYNDANITEQERQAVARSAAKRNPAT